MSMQLISIAIDVLLVLAAAEAVMISYGFWANAQSR